MKLPSRALALLTALTLLASCSALDGGASTPPPAADVSASDKLPPPENAQLKIAVSTDQVIPFAVRLAQDAGLFKKYGLDTDVVLIRDTTQLVQSLQSDQTSAIVGTAAQTINSLTTTQPLVDVGVLTNRDNYFLFAREGINSPADLRGKKVAIGGIGGSSHVSVMRALKVAGVSPDEVEMVVVGGGPAGRVAALAAGTVDAAPAERVHGELVADKGIKPLINLADAGDLAIAVLQVRRAFAESAPNTVLAILAAVYEAVQLQYTDRDYAIERYAAWARVTKDEAATAYNDFLDSGVVQRSLRSTAEAYTPYIEVLRATNPAVTGVDPADAFDPTFLDKLVDAGVVPAA